MRDPHIKGSIYVLTEGYMEVTHMLLKWTVVVPEAVFPTQPAPASRHTVPEGAITASVDML